MLKKIITSTFGGKAPLPQAVLLSVVFVLILQIPAHILMSKSYMVESVLVNEILAVLLVPLALTYFFRYDREKLFPMRKATVAVIVFALVATAGMDIIVDYLTVFSERLFPIPERYKEALEKIMSVGSTKEAILKISVLCFLPGVCEEIYFRGFCQGGISAKWGRYWGVAISAIIFSAMHGNPWYFSLYVLLGIFFSSIYIVSGTLIVPMVCHTFNNAWSITSHNLGIEPLKNAPFSVLDAIIIVAGAAALCGGIAGVYRLSRRSR